MSDSPINALRFTETNSSEDSQGRTWGLEGNLFWYVIGGGFFSVMSLLILFAVFHWSFKTSGLAALIPLALSLAYIFGFRQGKPPNYDRDICDNLLHGPAFSPSPLERQPQHPLHDDF
jgi:hypothetical protein